MNNKEIIIRLISADIKYHRLTTFLYKNQTIPIEFDIDLLTIVARTMGISGSLSDKWIDCYMEFINNSINNEPPDELSILLYDKLIECI